jgi:simple sugar transport system ATP-binding protein
MVLDRGRVALQASKAELGSAEALVNFMEELAHPGGAGVQSTGGTV